MVHRVPLQVREATCADAAALVALWCTSLEHNDTSPLNSPFGTVPSREPSDDEAAAAITEHLTAGDKRLWVAVADGEIVGLAAALWRTVTPIHLTRMVLVTELAVAPAWRRRSVGSMLLSTAAAWAEELDSEIVVTFAGHRQREPARFLTKLGFAQMVTARVVQTSVLRARLTARSSPARGTQSRGATRKIAVRSALRRRQRVLPDTTEPPPLSVPPPPSTLAETEPGDPHPV